MSETGPIEPRPRPRCPFYGMHALPEFGTLLTQGGNQCGLIIESYSPCRMEAAGLEIDFETCEFNGTGRAAEFADFERREFVRRDERGVEYRGGPLGIMTLAVSLEPGFLRVQFEPANDRLPAVVVLEFPNGQQSTFNAETGEMVTTLYPAKPSANPLARPPAKRLEQPRSAHGPRTKP